VSDRNYLLNVSKKLQNLKNSKFYWSLNEEYSLKYYNDIDYKTRLDLLLNDAKAQLSLNLTGYREVTTVNDIGNAHTLYLWNCGSLTNINAQRTVHILFLSMCKGISDVSALSLLHQ
jgi:hypothetical protein